jgi:hypothetical protein
MGKNRFRIKFACSIFRFQVSGVRKKKTEDRNQRSDDPTAWSENGFDKQS